jgi:enoyl-CoA hydratase/carnithine racemase
MGATIEFDGRIAIVRLDWPDDRNSLDASRAIELQEALADAENLADCRAVILAGSARSFCSGGDLRFFLGVIEETEDYVRNVVASVYQPLVTSIVQSPLPVLAAVDGAAIGLGMDLALACDLCFVGSRGWFMQGWARVGLIPGAGGTLFLDRRLSREEIWRLVVDQPRLGPQAIHDLGLGVDTGDEPAEEAARRFATRLNQLPRETVTGYKRLLQGLTGGLTAHLDQAQMIQVGLLRSRAFGDSARAITGISPRQDLSGG